MHRKIKEPTNPQLVHAIANEIMNVHLGHITSQDATAKIYAALIEKKFIWRLSLARGDYALANIYNKA